MLVTRHRGRGGRLAALLSVLVLSAAVLIAPNSSQAAPPPNPSDGQLTAAQAAKNALATQVGELSAQVARLQAQLDTLNADTELAEQKLALALQHLEDAKQKSADAAAAVRKAQANVVEARKKFTDFVRTTYMSSPVTGAAGQLLTASDPEALLRHGDYVGYAADHKLGVIGALNRATVAKSNADAVARAAVLQQQAATNAAAQAEQDAKAALQAAQAQQQQIAASLAAQQAALQAAQANLATLNNQRAAYDAYQAQQAELARQRAAAAAAAAAEAAAARQHAGSSGQGSGNGGGVPVAPAINGGWTPAAGQTAVSRAKAFLGWPYSFAAGNYNGPTFGIAVDADSRNDAHVRGFDCSGLTLYAWAPYIHMDHYASAQYSQAGSVHPNVASLMPGDLVFWSDNGTQSGISHVAVYSGGGSVVQAPFSGAYIEITPLNRVESGYYGATRPLT